MAEFPYEPQVVLDPSQGSGELVRSASGQVYAMTDLAFATPLPVRNTGGPIAGNIIRSSQQGVTEEFIVDDHRQVRWVSGPYVVTLTSVEGIMRQIDNAAQSAAVSATAADAAARRAVQFLTLDGAPSFEERIWAPSTQEPTEADGARDGDKWLRLP